MPETHNDTPPVTDVDGVRIVCWEDLKEFLGPERWEKFCEWHMGQTSLVDGAFLWDVEQFLAGGDDLEFVDL